MNDKYTQREWDRTVGIGKVPKEYKKPNLFEDYEKRIDYNMWIDVKQNTDEWFGMRDLTCCHNYVSL